VLFAVAAILVVTASGREGATDERTANNFASTDPTSAVVSGSGRLLRPGPKPVARKLLQNDLVPFIVNGQPVPRGQKLFMASLRKTWNGRHFCAGALVAPKYVITAAHCLDLGDREPEVHLGRRQRTQESQRSSEVEVRQTVRAIRHPSWTGSVGDGFDIALLELDEPSSQPTLSLPSNPISFDDNLRLEITGWGETESGTLADDLMQADVSVFDQGRCSSSQLYGPRITSSMVCAGGEGRDSCVGDSGGPLLVPGSTPVLAGITSFGKIGGCGQLGIPTVYTNINSYVVWVRSVIGFQTPASPPPRQSPPPSNPPSRFPPASSPPSRFPPLSNPPSRFPPASNPPSRFPPLPSSDYDDQWKGSSNDACAREGSTWNPHQVGNGCTICTTYSTADRIADCVQCCCSKGSSSQRWTYNGCPNIGFAEGSTGLRSSNAWGSGDSFSPSSNFWSNSPSSGVTTRWNSPSSSDIWGSSVGRTSFYNSGYNGKKR